MKILTLIPALLIASAWLVSASGALAAEPQLGLAARYPGDVGIERDPDVLFVEGFEKANWDKRWQERSRRHREHGHLDTDAQHVHTGRQSLRLEIVAGTGKGGAGWMHYWWDGDDEVYLRYYHKLSKNGDWRNQKIMQFHGHQRGVRYSRGAGIRPTGFDSMSAGTGSNLGLYSYWLHQKGNYGDWNPVNRGTTFAHGKHPHAPYGEWVCYEIHVKLNDVGQANGEQHLWVNGELVIEQTGMEWRKTDKLVVNNIMQPTYTHKPPKPGEDRALWLDSIVLAKKYIGPVVRRPVKAKRTTGKRKVFTFSPPPRPNDPLAAHRKQLASAEKLARGGQWGEAAAIYRKIADAVSAKPVRALIELRLQGIEARPYLIQTIVKGVASEGSKAVYIDFAGHAERARLVRATGREGAFVVKGSRMPLPWQMLSPRRVAGIAAKYAVSSADRIAIARFLLACGEADGARQVLDQALAARPTDTDARHARQISAALR